MQDGGCRGQGKKEPIHEGKGSPNGEKEKKKNKKKKLCGFSKCRECARYPHARLGPCDHHHAKGDALVQVPLLDGRRQADDSHQQQSGVFAILCGHLDEQKHVQSQNI